MGHWWRRRIPGTRIEIRGDDKAQWPAGLNGMERVARDEREAWLIETQIDTRFAAVDDARICDREQPPGAIEPFHPNAISGLHVLQNAEVRIAMCSDHAVA